MTDRAGDMWATMLTPYVKSTRNFQPEAVDPNTPSGQRPLVGGGAGNAIDMLLQSGAGQKAKNYAQMLMEAAKLPGDLASGRQQSFLGMRAGDFSDDPNAPDPNQHLTQGAVSLADIMSMGGMPMAAMRGAEHGALGIGVPPRIGRPGPQAKIMSKEEASAPFDPRGPWGQQPPPITRGPSGPPADRTDSVLTQIQDALKAAREPNSGVPLVGSPTPRPRMTTDEVLASIAEALKLAPR